MDTKLKRKLKHLIKRVGHKEAFDCLYLAKLSPSIIAKLLAGTYKSQLRFETIEKIENAIKDF